MTLARKSSSQAATLRFRRNESLPGALRMRLRDRPELGGVGVLMCYFSPKRSGRVGRFRPPKWPVSAAELDQIAARPTAPAIPIWRITIDQYTHTPKFWTVPEVEGHVFEGREVGGSVVSSQATFVVAEDHVEDPMEAVFDTLYKAP